VENTSTLIHKLNILHLKLLCSANAESFSNCVPKKHSGFDKKVTGCVILRDNRPTCNVIVYSEIGYRILPS
jgi:hypothetical protein